MFPLHVLGPRGEEGEGEGGGGGRGRGRRRREREREEEEGGGGGGGGRGRRGCRRERGEEGRKEGRKEGKGRERKMEDNDKQPLYTHYAMNTLSELLTTVTLSLHIEGQRGVCPQCTPSHTPNKRGTPLPPLSAPPRMVSSMAC